MTSAPKDWPKAVAFDLDGTLIDSAPDLGDALNLAIAKRGLAPFELDQVKEMIGGGVPKLVERALHRRGSALTELPSTIADFVQFYRKNLTTRTTLYPGARELLTRLQSEGRRLGICTNKQQALTLEILNRFKLANYFSVVVGEVEGLPRKPDPTPLRRVMEALGASPHSIVMVGDSTTDVECAHAAGVPAVIVRGGYSRVAPDDLGADAVIANLGDLPTCLSEQASEDR